MLFENKDGEAIGPETGSAWLRPYPAGFRKLLGWISARYARPRIYVTENGTSVKGETAMRVEDALDDGFRVEYFRGYIGALAKACADDGVDVGGYLAWSLME